MKPWAWIMPVVLCLVVLVLPGCATYTPPPDSMSGGGSPDGDLATEIYSRLSDDSMTGRYTFGVTVQGGVVTVQGAVPDEPTRTRILGIIRATPGVQSVVDRLYRI